MVRERERDRKVVLKIETLARKSGKRRREVRRKERGLLALLVLVSDDRWIVDCVVVVVEVVVELGDWRKVWARE